MFQENSNDPNKKMSCYTESTETCPALLLYSGVHTFTPGVVHLSS